MNQVLIVDRPFPFRKNGVGRYLMEIASALEDMEHAPDIRLLYYGRERSVPDWQNLIKSTPPSWQTRLNQRLGVSWGLRRTSASLIHYPTGTLHPGWAAGDVPVVLTLHGMGQYLSQPWYKDWQKDRVAKLRERFEQGRHKLKHVIAVSQYVKDQAVMELGLAPDDVSVVPNGVDFSRFYVERNRSAVAQYLETEIGITQPFWFHLGPGGPRKNVVRQLQAFARLKGELDVPHKFIIAGLAGNDHRKNLQSEAGRLGIEADVILMGEIRDDRLLRMLYNGAEIFVFPSLYEGFGIPVIEAMACGTPVVASATHSLPEASGQAAALVTNPEDVDEMTDVIRHLVQNAPYREELRERGLHHASALSWENSARGHAAVFQRILEELKA